ncbi:putative regulatory protein MerR [Magnetofaba australis IT-1]|uniref:Putative regulatory protein MerR n=2 Tax=Magnetofaba TaxID=1472292 RepID=A0A1Y2KA25_9PROT|nr:putative regulatory protein MerR [Magnetofaba australis IT-1]
MKYVTLRKFSELTGYSKQAAESKMKRGDWMRDQHYRKAPDGRILMDLEAIEKWIEENPAA